VRLIVLAVAALYALPAWATPSRELARARAEFDRGQYQTVVETLGPQLYPRMLIRDEKELIEAHYLLGVAYFYTDRPDQARRELTALLYVDPTYTLDPVVESPEVYAFFEGIKGELRGKLEELRKQKEKEAEARRRPSREVLVTRVVRDRSPWENFVPFGVGQFRNQQSRKGWFFLASQLASGGTSLGLFVAQAVQYGVPSRGVPLSDLDGLRTRQVVQIGAGAVFLLLYGWSVIDAFANQKPRVEETREERPISITDVPPPLIVPWISVTGDGGGLAFTWTF
jgi:hypothetical protein